MFKKWHFLAKRGWRGVLMGPEDNIFRMVFIKNKVEVTEENRSASVAVTKAFERICRGENYDRNCKSKE